MLLRRDSGLPTGLLGTATVSGSEKSLVVLGFQICLQKHMSTRSCQAVLFQALVDLLDKKREHGQLGCSTAVTRAPKMNGPFPFPSNPSDLNV